MIETKKLTFDLAYQTTANISQNICAKFSVDCDHQNRFPTESFAAIKASNLQALLVPKEP